MEQAKPKSGAGAFQLNIGRVILVGLAFLTVCMFWDIYDATMPLMLANFPVFDDNKTLTGLVMAADNLLALFLLPLMGGLSDNCKSKFGRRMPFILIGSVLAALLLLLLVFAHEQQMLVLMLVTTGFLLLAMCFYRTPAVALMPDVTPKPLRSKANAIINIMGVVGGVISMGLSAALKKTTTKGDMMYLAHGAQNWILFGIIAALIVLAAVVMALKIKERKMVEDKDKLLKEANYDEDAENEAEAAATVVQAVDSDEVTAAQPLVLDSVQKDEAKTSAPQSGKPPKKKGRFAQLDLDKSQMKSLIFLLVGVFLWYMAYNGCRTFFSTFSLQYLGNAKYEFPLIIGQVAGFIMFIPASIIGGKIGRKKTVMLGIIIMIAAFALATVAVLAIPKSQSGAIMALMYVCFVLVGAGWATINVHSFVMSVEMSKKHNVGVFTGIYYTFAMAAQALAPTVVGLITDLGNVGLRLMFPYALIFMILALVVMVFVRHGNARVEKPQSKLEYLDN